MPFDKIIDAVQDGSCDAGLLIHEGQLFYESKGLHKVLDLGRMVARAARSAAADGRQRHPSRPRPGADQERFRAAAGEYQLFADPPGRRAPVRHAVRPGHGTGAGRSVCGMWVNDLTLDYTERGREAVRLLCEGRAFEKGDYPESESDIRLCLHELKYFEDLRCLSWGVRGDFLSHPAQKGQLTTAHIIDLRPRKTKLLPKPGLSPAPCKQRRRSASRLRSRAVKLHGC